MKKLFWIALSLYENVGNKTIKRLYEYNPALTYSSINTDENIEKILKKVEVIESFKSKEIYQQKLYEAKRLVAEHEKKHIEVITIADLLYPELLRKIDDPPSVIYVKGNKELLTKSDCLAIIGTRNPTNKGILAGRKISQKFAEKGFTIVSGLAEGVDTTVHEGALSVDNGLTIAVLPSNIEDVYPSKNKELANRIIKQKGLLISETALGQKSNKGSFVLRDRIQSGLSLGICAIQASKKSGTHHTLAFAKKQNRLIICPIPLEPISVEQTQGIYELMKDSDVEVISTSADYERIENLLLKRSYFLKKNDLAVNSTYNLFNLIEE